MDQATQKNVFEEFFSTKGSAGTGMGLAVVEKVVNKHGGRIEVNSAPGKGSRFTLISVSYTHLTLPTIYSV